MCSQMACRGGPSLRDFNGGGKLSTLHQEDMLKVLQVCGRHSLKSTGHSSRFCEGTGIPIRAHISTSQKVGRHSRQAQNTITNALPTDAVSAAAAIVIVSASAGALLWINQDKLRNINPEKVKCEACDGSGLCSDCKGEGFQLRNLSPEAVEKARANARDAATRYTAGLAKKWSYCTSCSGSRSCRICDGRGRLSITRSGS